jgi:hypothetical protein
MSFADTVINRGYKSDRKKNEFMQVGQGAHTIRILQPQAKTYPTHFFKNTFSTVLCLEEDCPICNNNRSLWQQFDKEAKKQSGYNPRQYRFYVNVLDKTPAKTCEKCGTEYKDLRNTICKCGEVLPTEAKPINKVRILNKGTTLRDDLDSIDKAIQHPNGEPIGLMNYDIVLMVSGTQQDTKTTPVPKTDANEPIPEGLELFDLDKVVVRLEPSEMLDLQRGISVRDIFKARRAEEVSFEPAVSEEVVEQVNDAVKALFNQ